MNARRTVVLAMLAFLAVALTGNSPAAGPK
jgi:hypothetical protein